MTRAINVTRAVKAALITAALAVLPVTLYLTQHDQQAGLSYSPSAARQERVAWEASGALKERLDNEQTLREAVWVNGERARAFELYLQEQERQAAERAEAQRSAPRRTTAAAGAGTVGGSCGAPQDDGSAPPAGFPSGVIQRESGGDVTASNGTHDGRAQLARSHFCGGGCTGLSYHACWDKLWAGGAGASNWRETIGG